MCFGCPLEFLIAGGGIVRIVPRDAGEQMGSHIPVPTDADLTQCPFCFEVVEQLRDAGKHQLQIDHSGDGACHGKPWEMLQPCIPVRMSQDQGDRAAQVGDGHHVQAARIRVEQRKFRGGKTDPPAPASRVDRLNKTVDHQGSEKQREDITAKFDGVTHVPWVHGKEKCGDDTGSCKMKALEQQGKRADRENSSDEAGETDYRLAKLQTARST